MTTPVDRDDWLQLIAASSYLADLERPGFAVADAIEEALRRWTDAYLEPIDPTSPERPQVPWDDPDPLRTTLERLLAIVPPGGSYDGQLLTDIFISAVRAWVQDMAEALNDGRNFTVAPARGFPSSAT